MKKFTSLLAVVCIAATVFAGCGKQGDAAKQGAQGDKANKKYKIATVVKISGIAWFDRMKQGVDKFAKDTGNDAYQVGPQKADAALQVQIIEDLIAQKVDAICVVPYSQEALEPVLKKAKEKGIVVITHEASTIQNIDYDIEAFDNEAYGAHYMDFLAKKIGGEGEYATLVGGLTSKSHNEFIDGAIKLQKEKYPKMKLVAERIETADDQKIAYEKAKELLKAHPNLKAIQGSAMPDSAGVSLAIEEMGLIGKVHFAGTGLVSVAGKYLQNNSCDLIGFWDPLDAGYAMNKLALQVLQGQKPTDGMDLGVKGYNKLTMKGKVLRGQAWIDVTKDNMKDYDF